MSHDPHAKPSHTTENQQIRIETSDGIQLEAEFSAPTPIEEPPPAGVVVMCHPHPLHGGSMNANVVEAVYRALPPLGGAVLRFNFRGAGASTGDHDNGAAERLDVAAAIDDATARWPGSQVLLAGYSFGADVALAVDHPAVSGWLAVAPPLRVVDTADMIALTDERPKMVVGATHDQFNPYSELVQSLDAVPNTTVLEAAGADHFFAVGLDRVVDAARLALNL